MPPNPDAPIRKRKRRVLKIHLALKRGPFKLAPMRPEVADAQPKPNVPSK